MSPRGKIRICLKRTLTSTSSSPLTTTTEQTKSKRAKDDSERSAENLEGIDNENKKRRKEEQHNWQRKKSSTDWSRQLSPLASPIQMQNRPSSSDPSSKSPPSTEEGDDENPLPAAFRMVNGSESSDESGAERSEHEEEVIRRSKQIRNRERWELLKYKMLISSCCTPSKNHSKNGSEPPGVDEGAAEEEKWDEEREREFVFSLL